MPSKKEYVDALHAIDMCSGMLELYAKANLVGEEEARKKERDKINDPLLKYLYQECQSKLDQFYEAVASRAEIEHKSSPAKEKKVFAPGKRVQVNLPSGKTTEDIGDMYPELGFEDKMWEWSGKVMILKWACPDFDRSWETEENTWTWHEDWLELLD